MLGPMKRARRQFFASYNAPGALAMKLLIPHPPEKGWAAEKHVLSAPECRHVLSALVSGTSRRLILSGFSHIAAGSKPMAQSRGLIIRVLEMHQTARQRHAARREQFLGS